MNYRFTDSDFPGGKGKPAWFHKKTTPPQKRRAWFDEYNRRASNGQDNRGESHAPDTSTLTEEIEVAKREHVRRAGNGGEDVPPGPTPEEQAPPKKGKGTDEKVKEAQAAKLIKLARNAATALFHTPDLVCYADVIVSGHRETWQVRSKGFKWWLCRKYYEANSTAPNSEALQSALNMIEAQAHFDGEEMPVHVRVAGLGGYIYLDLCDAKWRAIEISASGWEVVENPPVRFRRSSGMKPLPVPVTGGEPASLPEHHK